MKITPRAKKIESCFQILPVLQIEHNTTGFAIVVGWGHYRAGIKISY